MIRWALEIRLQCVFARASLVVVTVLPFVFVLAYGYAHRDLTLSELLSGRRAAVLLPLAGIGLVLSWMRQRALALIDRGFSRSASDLGHESATSAGFRSAGIDDDIPAAECPGCGSIELPEVERCECGKVRRVASVPLLLRGKFRIERRLGAGGMGVVYAGRDIALGRPVALKTLSTLTASAAERLDQEARIMASVAHPNLATIFGLERWRSTPILIVEFLERGTLAARMAKGPLPIDQVLRLGALLAAALEQLHATGVLHRDVKPSNIAFSAGDVPKLLDFGLATFVSAGRLRPISSAADENGPAQTRTVHLVGGAVGGTPLYLSPEAIAGREPEPAWDVWALSLVLYEAIAGRHPFSAPSIPAVLDNITRTRVPDIRRFRPDCPESIARTFSSFLNPDGNDRPRSAIALQEQLQEFSG